jgi:hypothetical protein
MYFFDFGAFIIMFGLFFTKHKLLNAGIYWLSVSISIFVMYRGAPFGPLLISAVCFGLAKRNQVVRDV